MTAAAGDGDSWWGDVRLAEGETAQWRIGPLTLAVSRGRREWQLAYDWDPELDMAQDWEHEAGAPFPEEPPNHERYVVGDTGDFLTLGPKLADRPVISLPRVPFHLLPEQETTLYVGSPIWLRLSVGEPPVEIKQLPTRRPSDSWFGGSTREGEACYAIKTRALTDLDKLPVFHRSAVTPVLIRNQAADSLWLEKLKLPVPYLSLFAGQDSRLWTERVSLTRSETSGMASLDIRSGPPEEAPGAEPVTRPRLTHEPNLLIRAFGSLFG